MEKSVVGFFFFAKAVVVDWTLSWMVLTARDSYATRNRMRYVGRLTIPL